LFLFPFKEAAVERSALMKSKEESSNKKHPQLEERSDWKSIQINDRPSIKSGRSMQLSYPK